VSLGAFRGMADGSNPTQTALERAFELAGSGKVAGLNELRVVLKGEGFDCRHLEGPSVSRQLRGLIDGTPVEAKKAAGSKRRRDRQGTMAWMARPKT
jgi:hypothetical protein